MTAWACVTCGATGTYGEVTTKTDKALPDAKHSAACTGTVVTAATGAAAASIASRVRGGEVAE